MSHPEVKDSHPGDPKPLDAKNPETCIHDVRSKIPGLDTLQEGAPSRTRTNDPLITSQKLYQLSYGGLIVVQK